MLYLYLVSYMKAELEDQHLGWGMFRISYESKSKPNTYLFEDCGTVVCELWHVVSFNHLTHGRAVLMEECCCLSWWLLSPPPNLIIISLAQLRWWAAWCNDDDQLTLDIPPTRCALLITAYCCIPAHHIPHSSILHGHVTAINYATPVEVTRFLVSWYMWLSIGPTLCSIIIF